MHREQAVQLRSGNAEKALGGLRTGRTTETATSRVFPPTMQIIKSLLNWIVPVLFNLVSLPVLLTVHWTLTNNFDESKDNGSQGGEEDDDGERSQEIEVATQVCKRGYP
jgi:hypothetical protein